MSLSRDKKMVTAGAAQSQLPLISKANQTRLKSSDSLKPKNLHSTQPIASSSAKTLPKTKSSANTIFNEKLEVLLNTILQEGNQMPSSISGGSLSSSGVFTRKPTNNVEKKAEQPVQKISHAPSKSVGFLMESKSMFAPPSESQVMEENKEDISKEENNKEENIVSQDEAIKADNKTARTSISQIDRYKFTQADSKYKEITELRKQLELKEQTIDKLKKELEDIDEFRLALDRKYSESEFNEKRVSILKAQILKQSRLIKKLCRSLRLAKKFHNDIISILELFKDLTFKYAEQIEEITQGNLIKISKPNRVGRVFGEDSLYKTSDEQSKFKSIEVVLCNFETQENFNNFLKNFNEAYEQVKTTQRKTEEYRRVFLTSDSKVGRGEEKISKKVSYNKVFTEFVSRYKRLFPLKTLFDCFEHKEKEAIDNRIGYLITLSKKITEIFKQISDFNMFQNNPFFASQSNTPQMLLTKAGDFTEWMMKMNKFTHLILNHNEIMDTEKNLSELLTELSIFHLNLHTRGKTVSIDTVLKLQDSLRQSIEKLLQLGVSLEHDKNTNIYLNLEEVQPEFFANDNKSGLLSKKLTIIEEDPSKLLFYEQEKNSTESFLASVTGIDNFFSDIEDLVADNPNVTKKLKKARCELLKLNKLNEQFRTTSTIRALDICLHKDLIEVLNKAVRNLDKFVEDKAKFIDQFFENAASKIDSTLRLHDEIFESNEELTKKAIKKFGDKFKKNIRDVSDMIKSVLKTNTQHPNTSIRSLKDDYKARFSMVEEEWHFFAKSVDNEIKKIEKLGEKL